MLLNEKSLKNIIRKIVNENYRHLFENENDEIGQQDEEEELTEPNIDLGGNNNVNKGNERSEGSEGSEGNNNTSNEINLDDRYYSEMPQDNLDDRYYSEMPQDNSDDRYYSEMPQDDVNLDSNNQNQDQSQDNNSDSDYQTMGGRGGKYQGIDKAEQYNDDYEFSLPNWGNNNQEQSQDNNHDSNKEDEEEDVEEDEEEDVEEDEEDVEEDEEDVDEEDEEDVDEEDEEEDVEEEDDEDVGSLKGHTEVTAGTFIVPPLKRGYYDMARIFINNTQDLNQKLIDKGYGFTDQQFNSFKDDVLLYKDEQDIVSNFNLVEFGDELQAMKKDLGELSQDLFEKTNKVLSNEPALAKILQKYFSDKLLHPKNKLNMSGFIAYARLNALKAVMKKEGMDANAIMLDEANILADDVYQDFIKDKGSLTKYLQSRNKNIKTVQKEIKNIEKSQKDTDSTSFKGMAKGRKAAFPTDQYLSAKDKAAVKRMKF